MSIGRVSLAALWLVGGTAVLSSTPMSPGFAQQPAAGSQQAPPRAQTRPAQQKGTPARESAAGGGSTEAALRSRIEQLEEQLSDMRVEIGTLESLARGGQAGSAGTIARAAPSGGIDTARLDSLEMQIRALTNQMEQLADQVRQLAPSRRGEAAPAASPGSFAYAPPPRASGRDGWAEPAATPGSPIGGFGSTTITPGQSHDPIGRILGEEQPQVASAASGLQPSTSPGNPRELYETGYGYLLQQDYGAAEAAFDEFLRRYPGDRLAADAQYWLGETLYVQRRYKPAGQAFLTVIEKHKTSAKVPHSLLKLAQSLEQLGQKDCGIFNELETRHPNAPADVRVKARALKQKHGC